VKFDIVFKRGLGTFARVAGFKNIRKEDLTLAEWEEVLKLESLLEKLTSYRVHIQQDACIDQ
jgi:hypothetical protein